MEAFRNRGCDIAVYRSGKRSLVIRWTLLELFFLFRGAPAAYGSSQARGLIGAVAASLRQSHSNVGSEPHLQPTPQLTAMLDP